MRPRIECVGTVRVALSPEAALPLFTPEGERDWVEGWEPTYPAGAGAAPGPRELANAVGGSTGPTGARASTEVAARVREPAEVAARAREPAEVAARGREPERGLVFVVGKEGGASVWLVTRYDPAAGGASYVYVLPGHRAVLIDVDLAEADDGDGSLATVVYRMTSLAPKGDAFVRDFEEGFGNFLRGWEEDLRRYLGTLP